MFIDNLNISFEDVTAINQNTAIQSVQLFPNPATSEVTIQHPEKWMSGYKLIDVFGKKIISQEFNNCNQKNIDVSSLAKGYYFVVVESLESSQTIPFFKN